jgi:hypothetical protein
VIGQMPLDRIFEEAVGKSVEVMCPANGLEIKAEACSAEQVFSQTEYRRALGNVCELQDLLTLDAIGWAVEGPVGSDHVEVNVPAPETEVLLKIWCLVQDLGTSAALVVTLIGGGTDPRASKPGDKYFSANGENAAVALRLFCKALCTLEGLLRSSEVTSLTVNYSAVVGDPSLQVITCWRDSMSHLAGECTRQLLRLYRDELDGRQTSVRDALPLWQSVFKDDVLSVDMAVGLFRGKFPSVIGAHNMLHQVLSSVARVGTTLEVLPSVDKHEITSAAIAIGSTRLQEAKLAASIMHGVEILTLKQQDAGAQADAFLLKHCSKPGHGIPDALLRELKHMQEYAGKSGLPTSTTNLGVFLDDAQAAPSPHFRRVADKAASVASSQLVAKSQGAGVDDMSSSAPLSKVGAPKRALKRLQR